MWKFKIYSDDYGILTKVCNDYSLTPDIIYNPPYSTDKNNVIGLGYVSNGKHLRVFGVDSFVDLSSNIPDITSEYVHPSFSL